MPLFSRSSPKRVRAVIRLVWSGPDLRFESLVPGVDNFRHDVHLSPRFIGYARGYIFKLFMKHSRAPQLVEQTPDLPKLQERNEFRRLLQEVLLSALNQAKAARNSDTDLLGNVAVFKYLGWEMQQQYSRIQMEGKNKLRMYEGPRHDRNLRAFQLKEFFSEVQADKKNILRRVSSPMNCCRWPTKCRPAWCARRANPSLAQTQAPGLPTSLTRWCLAKTAVTTTFT